MDLGGGMSVFAQNKMCDYQRSSGHVVTRRGSTGRSTVPYRCTIDVRTRMGPSGVPTGPPGPRRDPTDPRLTAGGTVGPPRLGGPQLLLAQPRLLVGSIELQVFIHVRNLSGSVRFPGMVVPLLKI